MRKMRLNNGDVQYLIRACLVYQEQTGSEDLWEKYDDLINKLRVYSEQNLTPSE